MPKGANITIPNEQTYESPTLVEPYSVRFQIEGTRAYLFNRYDVPPNGGEEPLKGQKVAKPLGAMVTLDPDGFLAARAVATWNAVTAAGKYRRNPRSSKGSLATVLRESLEIDGLDPRCPDLLRFVGPDGTPYERWEFEFTSRVKNAGAFSSYVTRIRPAIHPGWRLSGLATIQQPEYVSVGQLHEAFAMAGRFGGLGDGRTVGLGFGRFLVRSFEVAET